MKITVDDLRRLAACEDGIQAFAAAYPDGWAGEWTASEQLAALRTPLRKYLGWAWRTGLLPAWGMRDAHLARAHLEGADLEGAYLEHANLEHAYLRHADLRHADLRHANLRGANLRGAYLEGADLRGALGFPEDVS